ncbi:MAG: hypothetical protein FWC81_04095 [Coriobacteriia bacterium]|nr:hypothetical protein [Coriobacteriia bacterium]
MNVEAHITKWIDSLNLGLEAYTDVPAKRPAEFATVKRIGGQRDNIVIDRPRIVVQVWAASNERVAELAYQVDKHIAELTRNNRISKVSRVGMQGFSAADSGHARYQIEIDLVCLN